MIIELGSRNMDVVSVSQAKRVHGLVITSLTKAYRKLTAVDDISLRVPGGEFLTLLSPSGSGKATLLMMIAGFVQPTDGDILVDEKRITNLAPESRRLLILAPMIVPPISSALAFYKLFSYAGLLDSFPGVILSHTVLAAPYVVVAVSASLATLDLRQEQSSRSLGASPLQAIRWVIVPQITPGVITGAVFAFLVSWDEVVVTLFVAAREVYTLPRKMWDGINERVDPTIAAAVTILLLITLLLLGLQALRDVKNDQALAKNAS